MVGQLSFGNSRIKTGYKVKILNSRGSNITSLLLMEVSFYFAESAAETSGVEFFRSDFPDAGPKSSLPLINYTNIVPCGVDSNQ